MSGCSDRGGVAQRLVRTHSMKQVIRRGLKEIIVDNVPDPTVTDNHVLVKPFFSLISSGT